MKKVVFFCVAIFATVTAYSQNQQDTLSTLQVNGRVKIDSSLHVKDTATFENDVQVLQKMTVEQEVTMRDNTEIQGDLIVRGNTSLNGDLNFPQLADTSLNDDELLLIDVNGKVTRSGNMKNLIYAEEPPAPCAVGPNGEIIPASPYWKAKPNVLYVKDNCVTDPKVGINTSVPSASLTIVTNDQTNPLLIAKPTGEKVVQVGADGIMYAREIKVDLSQAWPDYVFAEGYALMPVEALEAYIAQYGHLPNVPGAGQMETEGVNVTQSTVMLMEKVEELTLYIIQLQEQLQAQQVQIGQLQSAGH